MNPKIDDLYFLFRKKWTVCLLVDLHMGSKKFQDFKKNLPDISPKVLYQTLNDLEEMGLVEKKIITEKPKSTEYQLTENGKLSKDFIKEYFFFLTKVSSDSRVHEKILKEIQDL